MDGEELSDQRTKQTFTEAMELMAWNCYRSYESIRSHLDGTEFTWTVPWPTIQPTNIAWTDDRIATGLYILKETRKAQELLNEAAVAYLAQCRKETGADDKDAAETGDGLHCTCAFLELSGRLVHDRKAGEQLAIMKEACQNATDMYLHNFFIREEYSVVFEAYRYIAVVIHREDVAEQVDTIFARLENGRNCWVEPHETKRLRHIKERKALMAVAQQHHDSKSKLWWASIAHRTCHSIDPPYQLYLVCNPPPPPPPQMFLSPYLSPFINFYFKIIFI